MYIQPTIRKPDLYEKTVILRNSGFSYSEIAEYVSVSKGTISRWCRDIPLTNEQIDTLLRKKYNTPLIQGVIEQSELSKKEANEWAKEQNKLLRSFLKQKKILILLAAMLYWAEGTKLNEKRGGHRSVDFTNTDPRMIKLMMRFFREILQVSDYKFRLIIRIDKKGNLENAQNFWLEVTQLTKKNLRRPELLVLGEKSKSLIKYPYGMCRLGLNDVTVARKFANLIDGVCRSLKLTITPP